MADWIFEDSIEKRIDLEREQIARIREARGLFSQTGPSQLVGLALSSGGLRSATFCLGVLQGLAAAGLLRGIDYLSCVGGGGYIGGRLAAMIARDGFERANQDLAKEPILLPNAPSARFFLSSAIGLLVPLLVLLAGTILLVWELLTVIVPLYWSQPSARLSLLFQFTAPGASLMVIGAALFGLKKLFPTGRSISRFVGKKISAGRRPAGSACE
ncbi:hypothetical protein [Bradyrhizobium sp. McL0616]|uniref:hypothetical protein n=1 Tax=Bradyrhizobium sp. McL0616 TaxID=3415674 RepID=UPI003CF042C0